MTRFARMPKKKHLEASTWKELSQQQQVKHEEKANDEEKKLNGDSKPENKKEKKKSKKRNLETEDNTSSEHVSSPKKQKMTDPNTLEPKRKKKKNKKKENLQSKDKKKTISKDTLEVDSSTKADEGQGMKVKFIGSRKAEKLKKQREARRRRRAKSKGIACFHCRELGHRAAECPQLKQERTGIGMCYRCGSSDHTTKNCQEKDAKKGDNPFPFAKCFICGDVGHLSSGCPDNPRGLYPKGGGCNSCGSVEHLQRDCPEAIKSKKKDVNVKSASHSFKRAKYTSADAEIHSDDEKPQLPQKYHKKNKTVKF